MRAITYKFRADPSMSVLLVLTDCKVAGPGVGKGRQIAGIVAEVSDLCVSEKEFFTSISSHEHVHS